MASHSNSPARSAVPGIGLLVLVWLALGGRELRAAPAAEIDGSCQRGTDQVRGMVVWHVLNGRATTTRWKDRPYIVHLPPSYDGTVAFPVVIVLHGGGGDARAARAMTCPNGNLGDPGCLDRVADCQGFITVYPDGTSERGIRTMRTFDAGGGADGYACVSGVACSTKVDDLRYFTDLIDTLEQEYTVDPARIYLTGLSNGGAMSQRLACELSDRIAAIAPVAGGNQYAAVDTCSPTRPVPMLEIHGTADRCWPYAGGPLTCVGLGTLAALGDFVPIPDTVASWAARNGCQAVPTSEDLPDVDRTDGTTVTRISYQGCSTGADVVLLRVNGGGHTWPGGSSVLPPGTVGKVSRDVNANSVIWEFFAAHPMR